MNNWIILLNVILSKSQFFILHIMLWYLIFLVALRGNKEVISNSLTSVLKVNKQTFCVCVCVCFLGVSLLTVSSDPSIGFQF